MVNMRNTETKRLQDELHAVKRENDALNKRVRVCLPQPILSPGAAHGSRGDCRGGSCACRRSV